MIGALSACGNQTTIAPKEDVSEEQSTQSENFENEESRDGSEFTDKDKKDDEKELNSEDAKRSIDDGTYEAEASDHNGSIKLAVTFADNKIDKIDILESSETEVITDVDYPMIFDRIIEHQSSNVDGVTGATVTSNTVKQIASNTIDQANGSDNFKAQISEQASDPVELETDLLVIGGSGAGLTAAISADEKGLDVVVLEKNAMLGGHTALSG